MKRHAGLILPLFSAIASDAWGIGEIPSLGHLARWMASAGFDRLMLLPVGTIAPGQASPYSAASTMSIDPAFIALAGLEDFERAGGEAALSAGGRRHLALARHARAVSYADVRPAKREALVLAFERFMADEWAERTPRAGALAAFIARERWWLDDYALFHALVDAHPRATWRTWPEPVRMRDPHAIARARRQLGPDLLRHQYWQWLAQSQWDEARAAARDHGVALIGDLPFVASPESVDVWSRQDEFVLDVSTGVPPDAFSADGQDWGLPFYDWPAIARSGYRSFRDRLRRMAALVDGVRVDHLVGLYRTYGRPQTGEAFFSPAAESDQLAQGEALIALLKATGLELIAEDLGTVPDFVRASLARHGVPGCRILRWEREWRVPGQPFLDPAAFPPESAAMTGTHDTEPLSDWWRRAPADERAAAAALPAVGARLGGHIGDVWDYRLRDAFIDLAFRAGSNDVFLPMQDVFGWSDRINTPSTVGDANWTWRLPWPVDEWASVPEARERAAFSVNLAHLTGRGGG